ncbi:MAG TPA: FISUMP domain-containing protein [Cyclobacteriaceae bacterium]|nr:FISUMP domain-containing protein [Cyclobacteriaceae bacterium]
MNINIKSAACSFFMLAIFLLSCKKEEETPKITPPDPVTPKFVLAGFAQKGPYLKGGTVTISELKADLTPTGRTFTTTVNSNSGYFGFNDAVNQFAIAELTVDGLYFNEIEGRVSEAPLKLSVITDRAKNGLVNINVMSHIEKERVKFLVAAGSTFTNAKTQAAREVLAVFGVANVQLSELMDIAQKNDLNGGLLAMSVILQAHRSVTDMSAVIAAIGNDIRADGILNDNALKSDLKAQALSISLGDVRNNLWNRYVGLEVKTAGVPNFESPLNEYNGQGTSRGIMNDITGRSYRTLRIGAQWWMVDNLKAAFYSNGVAIPNGNSINGDDAIVNYFTRDRTYGNPGTTDDPLNYGYFYTRAAAMNGKQESHAAPSGVQGVCPNGWHVPSTAEYDVLLDHIQSRGYDRSLDVLNNEVGFNLAKVGWRGYDILSWGDVNADWALAATDGKVSNDFPTRAAVNVRCVKD